MKSKIIYITIMTVIIFIAQINSQENTQHTKFNSSDYPDSCYITTQKEYKHGECNIKIIQVKVKDGCSLKTLCCCRAWIEVSRNKNILFKKHFNDIDAVGSQYGLFVPISLPSTNYFAIIKLGDYQGLLFLINKEGLTKTHIGGSYIISKDGKYLFSEYSSDIPGFSVINLKNGETICYAEDNIPDGMGWYYNNGEYFVASPEKPDTVFIFDQKLEKIITKNVQKEFILKSQKLNYDFYPPDDFDCGCANK